MSTSVLLSVSHYLTTSYRPDRDYVDGSLEERNVGEWAHSRVQARLIAYLFARESEFKFRVVPEQRVQVSETRFRVPDVCVVLQSNPIEPVLRNPPFLCVEILSKDDTVRQLNERITDYFKMGVKFVWVLDPLLRSAYNYTPGQMREVLDGYLRTEHPDLAVTLDEVLRDD